MRVLIAGGGTGGHVIPALAIARELKTRYQAEVLFVGTARGHGKPAGAAGRFWPDAGEGGRAQERQPDHADDARCLICLVRWWMRARSSRSFSPDVVVGVGGYASGPAMAAAILMHIPTLAFEPNYVPGFANKIVGHRVSAAAVHFEQTQKYFPQRPGSGRAGAGGVFQGRCAGRQPSANAAGLWRQPGRAGHQPGHGGGCSGSTTTNSPLRIIHQTGEREYNDVQAAYARQA